MIKLDRFPDIRRSSSDDGDGEMSAESNRIDEGMCGLICKGR